MLNSVQPVFKRISRSTLRSNIVRNYELIVFKIMKKLIDFYDVISMTSDL